MIGLPQGAAVPQQAPSCLETRRARVVFPDLFLYRAMVSHFPASQQFRAPRAWCLGRPVDPLCDTNLDWSHAYLGGLEPAV